MHKRLMCPTLIGHKVCVGEFYFLLTRRNFTTTDDEAKIMPKEPEKSLTLQIQSAKQLRKTKHCFGARGSVKKSNT